MNKFISYWLVALALHTTSLHCENLYDLSLVGNINFSDGFGRQCIGVIDCLKDCLSINYLYNAHGSYQAKKMLGLKNVNPIIEKILQNEDRSQGRVILYEAPIAVSKAYKNLDPNSIRIAYSMTSSSRLKHYWANVLNANFDAVAVPSSFLIDAYQKSGVKIPIFLLPLGVYLDEFFTSSIQTNRNGNFPFIFGSTEAFQPRKNHDILIQAFLEEFKDNPSVILRLNGRKQDGSSSTFAKLEKMVKEQNAKNILLSESTLSWHEYIQFMKDLSCCVNISQGEGYSIIPREAMALGVPCILSNNTAQSDLCKVSFVRSIQTNPQMVLPKESLNWYAGSFFQCTVLDVRKALRDIYNNYDQWLHNAQSNRTWVSQFTWNSLQKKYLSLIKPKKIVLGTKNHIHDTHLETNSIALYKKYLSLFP